MSKVSIRWVFSVFLVIILVIGMGARSTPHSSASAIEFPTIITETFIVSQETPKQSQNDPLSNIPENSEQPKILGFLEAKEAISWLYRFSFTAITTLVLLGVLILLKRLLKRAHARISDLQQTRPLSLNIQNLQILSSENLTNGLLTLASSIRLALSLLAVGIYLAILPNYFPQTEAIGRQVQTYFLNALGSFWHEITSYLPNVIAIFLVGFITYYVLKFLRLIFKAVKRGQLDVPGFHQEWIQPTYRLAQTLTLLSAAALIFPNLPGFGSPSFQGISILIGALLTLGGASTISNLIGGFIMIYTRAFQVGDRIRLGHVGQYTGNVLEKSIMSTRIRTSTNEIITVPNAIVMASTIVNYTATLRELEKPLILYTKVILGYDTPWRKVHQALIAAAQATPYVLEEPAPFVYQTGFSDYYVTYELRIFTYEVDAMSGIYSELRQNILDQFQEYEIQTLPPQNSTYQDSNLESRTPTSG